jgi:multiple sugar transport system permease protein
MLRKIGLHTGLVLACLSILLPVLWIVRTSLVPESMATAAIFSAVFRGKFPFAD